MPTSPAVPDSVTCDVAVIGAGINGAAVSLALSRAGYRVLLLDQADIAAGTSQASTMLIWGGLLYLRHLDLRAILSLSRDRDRLVGEWPALVAPQPLLYAPTDGLPSALVSAAMAAYWLLGAARRRRPQRRARYPEQSLLAQPARQAHMLEEAALTESDARFVLALVREADACGARVRTYTRVDQVESDRIGIWHLGLTDTLNGTSSTVSARCIVNATGTWADALNARAGIETPWRHAFSRGVSLVLRRDPRHRHHLIVDSRIGDALTLAPWGPVAVWASTDTAHPDPAEAARVAPEDVWALLEEYNRHFRPRRSAADVLSVRVGVRALPVPAAGVTPDVRGLTRHHRIHRDSHRPWVTIYGGKISGCLGLGQQVTAEVARAVRRAPSGARANRRALCAGPGETDRTPFPGLDEPVVSADWAVAHEYCRTLDDYLRRRTNIAQWVPQGGLGARDEHATLLHGFALDICGGNTHRALEQLNHHRRMVLATRQVLDAATASLKSSVTGQHVAVPDVPLNRSERP